MMTGISIFIPENNEEDVLHLSGHQVEVLVVFVMKANMERIIRLYKSH